MKNQDLDLQLRAAYNLLKNNKLEAAHSEYLKILASNPNHFEALHALGIIAVQEKKESQALEYFLKALQQKPDDPSIHNHLGNVFKRQKEFDKAILHYQEAIKLNSKYTEAHHNLAITYAAQNNISEALQHYQKALILAPESIIIHFHLGLLFLKNNQPDYARVQFQNVIALNPNHQEAKFHLGALALNQDELQIAEQYFQDVITKDPEHPYALNNLGIIALKQEQNQVAINFFTKALRLNPEDSAIRNNLAAIFMHHDRYENAWVHYEHLLNQEPNSPEYLYNGGVAQMVLGGLDKAEELFLHLLELHPNHVDALTNLAAIFKRQNKLTNALEYLERARELAPEDPSIQFMYKAFKGGDITPDEGCPTYVKHLFNNYALYYDQHIQKSLQYSIPSQIGKQLHLLPDLQHHHTLDLGCGTGLTGVVLREMSDRLVGVDISKKMLNQAKNKGIYDSLIEDDILNFLSQDTSTYSLIIAGDVLPYFGQLEDFFRAVKNHLQDNGFFIFTIENGTSYPYALQTTARFTHHQNYISYLCQQLGFIIESKEQAIGRYQDSEPVLVITYTLAILQ